jgi:hypothetical protein
MTITDAILDEAYSICNEFGPSMYVSRKERLKKGFEQLSTEEIDAVLKQMEEVAQTVSSLVTQGGPAKLGKETVIKVLQEKHPFLQAEGLQQAVFLVDYLAWHDAY